MSETRRAFVAFFTSLKLTVVLLALSIILIFWATLAQVKLGIWGVQQEFFRTFFVLGKIPGTEIPIPLFPGGYTLGGFLLVNLIAAHACRFKFSLKKSGILLTHFGLILLLLGELATSLWQEEFMLRLDEGQTRNYAESTRETELAIANVSDPAWDDVVAIPTERLETLGTIQHPGLPFRVVTRAYYPNAFVDASPDQGTPAKVPELPVRATRDIGTRSIVRPQPITYREDQRNWPTSFVELFGPEGSLGTWMLSAMLIDPQTFEYGGRTWTMQIRPERRYLPFSLNLIDFSHDRYAGTNIPKNFSSRLHLRTDDGREDRDVLIYMNNPLRAAGMTFYQASFDNDDKTTILQVVRNPGWLVPYIACIAMAAGMVIQFGMHLVGFARKRSAAAAQAAARTAPSATSLT
ncbi:MAG: cytochrome c biogenesis protein ResB [Opitutaceae bacterium]|nr:cytochrome c biogenesis protein ResB [Opitutaceae bacterium]